MTLLWMYSNSLCPERGGTERITDLIMKGLSSRGHSCIAMLVGHKDGTFYLQEQPIPDLLLFLQEKHVDIVINQMAYQQWLLDSFLNHGGRVWQLFGGKIISCLHFDPEQPSMLQLLRSNVHKKINDYIQIIKQLIFYPYYFHKNKCHYANLYNYIYDHSDKFILLSETHYPYIKGLMKRDDYSKLTAINNPLTFPDISTDEILTTKKHQVLIVARMDEFYKRISLALKAWKYIQTTQSLDDWELVIVGSGPSYEDYKQYALDNQLLNVYFMGHQSPEPYYHDASIFLMTSSKEGWGLTITESLQRGVVPIAMESCPVFREIIQDGYNGYIVPNKGYKVLASRMLLLMHEETKRITMGKNALKSAAKFAIDSTIDKWESVISFSIPSAIDSKSNMVS